MRTILVLVLVAACATPHTKAENFVLAVDPDADRVRLGESVLIREGQTLSICYPSPSGKRGVWCQPLADWTPKEQSTPVARPDASPAAKVEPEKKPDPPKPEEKPAPKPEAKSAEKKK